MELDELILANCTSQLAPLATFPFKRWKLI